jgi:hypothetical protein
MTQALDRLHEPFAQREGAYTAAAPAVAASEKFGTFAITFGIAFALLYTVFERLNWPLFTYHPASGKLDFWKEMTGVGPPMFWYGWLALSAISATIVAVIATAVPGGLLRRATVFCCLLAALWPASLWALQVFIDWVSFDAQFLNSVWLAAIPAVVIAAAVSYALSTRAVARLWTGWLLIVPIGGLLVLGYSLKPWFVR